MNKITLAVLFASLVALVAVLILFNFASSYNHPQVQASEEVLATCEQNCSKCYGHLGEGFEGYPALTGTDLSVTDLKTISHAGKGNMPSFSYIPEPLLSDWSTISAVYKKYNATLIIESNI